MSLSSGMRSPGSNSIVGYRFYPTDEELVGHFLMQKLLCFDDENVPIPEIKVCDHEPWELPDMLKKESNDQSWYFFSPRDYKYSNRIQVNRKTKAGNWKPTGKPRKVINKRTKRVIGTKRSLVFYKKGNPKPIRTSFIMQEYDVIADSKGNFLLYKLKLKLDEKINKSKSASPFSDFRGQILSPITADTSPGENELSEHMTCNLDSGTDSTGGESETCYYLDSDFEEQNQDKQSDITVAKEGEWGSPAAPDSGNKNLPDMADLWNLARASDSEVKLSFEYSEVNLPVGTGTFFDQVEALSGPEDSSNYALLSPFRIDDCRTYYGIDFSTSEPGGSGTEFIASSFVNFNLQMI